MVQEIYLHFRTTSAEAKPHLELVFHLKFFLFSKLFVEILGSGFRPFSLTKGMRSILFIMIIEAAVRLLMCTQCVQNVYVNMHGGHTLTTVYLTYMHAGVNKSFNV